MCLFYHWTRGYLVQHRANNRVNNMKFQNEKQYRVYWSKEYNDSLKLAQENGSIFPPMPLDEYKDSNERIPALISFDTNDEAINFIANLYEKNEQLSESDLCIVDDSGIPMGVTHREKWLPKNFWDGLDL